MCLLTELVLALCIFLSLLLLWALLPLKAYMLEVDRTAPNNGMVTRQAEIIPLGFLEGFILNLIIVGARGS